MEMTDVERCPSCKRLHRVLRYGWGYRFVPHLDDGVFCKGSRRLAAVCEARDRRCVMTAAAVVELPQAGDVVELSSCAVKCSRCGQPTTFPVFMGYCSIEREDRLPVWWCRSCKRCSSNGLIRGEEEHSE